MKKKGVGGTHLEFVLSFVIFVMFLVFLYGGIEPVVQTAGSKQFVLGHLRNSLIENFTLSDFTIQTFTVTLPGSPTDNCIKVTGGELNNLAAGKNLTIKNSLGKVINYSISGNLLIGPVTADDTLIKVYYASAFQNRSPEYTGKVGGCTEIPQNKYEIRSVTDNQIISELNIFDICNLYSSGGYDGLKDSLGVPAGSEFSFVFEDAGGVPVCPKNPIKPPQGVNVYAGKIPIQYIDSDATTKIGFIILSVW